MAPIDVVDEVLQSWDAQGVRRTGASKAELTRLENKCGRLPGAFWRLWVASDGTGYHDEEMFHFWSVEEILESKREDPEIQTRFSFCDFLISSHLYGFGQEYPHAEEIYLVPGTPHSAEMRTQHPPRFIASDIESFFRLYLDRSRQMYG